MSGYLCLVSFHYERLIADVTHPAARDRAARILNNLAPLLLRGDAWGQLGEALKEYVQDGAERDLVFVPFRRERGDNSRKPSAALWVARSLHDTRVDHRVRAQLLAFLNDACAMDKPAVEFAVEGPNSDSALVNTLKVEDGCWDLVSFPATNTGSFGFVSPTALEIACLVSVLAAGFLGVSIIASLRAHAALIRDIKLSRNVPLASGVMSPVPELSESCLQFTQLVAELRGASDQIVRAAEDMAHDLKTPLAVISVALKQIHRGLPDNGGKLMGALEAANQSVERMFASISLAQAIQEESAALMITPRLRANLGAAVAEAISSFARDIEARQLSISARIDDLASIATSEGTLDALLRNVIGNAVYASPRSGVIRITLQERNREALLWVDDEGSPVSPDFVDELFARGRSLHAGNNQPERSALTPRRAGYFIAKRNANLLGGDLVISNRQAGRGLSTLVRLPLF